MDKRGQGLSTNAIVLIVLGVVVLVILIVGFTVGWKNLAPWLSADNVDTIKNQCSTACATNSVYDYCTKERELKVEGEVAGKKTCYEWGEDNPYGIAKCPTLAGEIACKVRSCKAIEEADKEDCEALTERDGCEANVKCKWE